ncbi:hypothetical protein EDB89DRAFT_1324638 [Lactarius sanguifluus]|nr:hypothetical protein EDB89DRAFT_1324638 [Lactarius sanguifluus]
MARVVQASFPVLTRLGISSKDEKAPPLPRRFLGGSAPRLQQIHLDGILYPALPTLLLSTSDLVSLKLCRVPPAGYISPEVMITCLAALPRLTSLLIDFKLITPHPNQRHPPPVTRTVLPALTNFRFEGASGYLESLVTRIDSPQLLRIDVFYSDRLFHTHIALLLAPLSAFVHRLVHRSTGSELTTFGRVDISLWSGQVDFALRQANINCPDWDRRPGIDISCRTNTLWRLSDIAQVLSQFSATRSTVVHLELGVPIRVIFESDAEKREAHVLEMTGGSEWLLLLQQFPAMRTLHVSRWLSKHVALALERTGETGRRTIAIP